jgi:hypothetical protein
MSILPIVTCTPIARQRVGKQVPSNTDSWHKFVARVCNSNGSCLFRVRGDFTTVENDHMTYVFCRSD